MVLELHRGTIEVDSSEGVGSTFAVHLPAPAPAADAAVRLNLGAA
jgi:signal transduction histidine kinase